MNQNIKNILVIGDLMLDEFVYGNVNRISPEAPVPILNITRTNRYIGGCGNVANNLKSLGMEVFVFSQVGDDINGEFIKEELNRLGINFHLLNSDFPTIVKTRFISETNKHVLRVDNENIKINGNITEKELDKFILENHDKFSSVILSDYGKGMLSLKSIKNIMNLSKSFGFKVFVDSKTKNYESLSGAFLFKPNLSEFQKAVGVSLNDKSDIVKKVSALAEEFINKIGIENIVVTLGSLGMVLVSKDGKTFFDKQKNIQNIYDVSGAGDTAMATIVSAYENGYSLQESIQFANIASGIVVHKFGTSTVSKDEVFSHRKIHENVFSDIPSLEKEISVIRKNNPSAKIGFTNGCFDCCHYGHLYSIKKSKELCDFLVVAVNGDDWIRRHKGKHRPIQDEKTRISVISSLKFVDFCIMFNEETACEIIDRIRPDVYSKQVYENVKCPEADFVKSYGGKVVFLDNIAGYSTTSIEQKIKNS